jgi:hypothetical protein
MKPLKNTLLAFAIVAMTNTLGCSSDPNPNYEVVVCPAVEKPAENLFWLKQMIEHDLTLRNKGISVYTAKLDNKLVYVIKNPDEYVYSCEGKHLCFIESAVAPAENDPKMCANMLKHITEKKLIYQH